jgi:hypothetical protein
MEDSERAYTNLKFRLRRDKDMPAGFTMHFRVEVKAINKGIRIRE